MNSSEALEKLLHSYERYYDISTENIAAPFVAEAVFKSHNEQYFLVKEAKLSDIDSNEFVFFCLDSDKDSDIRQNDNLLRQNDNLLRQNDNLVRQNDDSCRQGGSHAELVSAFQITEIAQTAWERGLSRVTPYYGHRNTDITLIFISDKITDETFKHFKKLKFYKSYKFGLFGWSAFRALAYDSSTGRAVTNRRGSDLKKLVDNIRG